MLRDFSSAGFSRLNLSTLIGYALVLTLASPSVAAAAPPPAVVDHGPWDLLLKRYVRRGQVDYAGLRASPKDGERLRAYITVLGSVRPETLADKNSKLAFWLNAYNACVLQEVLKAHPVASVMEVKGFFKKASCRVAGELRSLDALENKIIRPRFAEPRIHFALVCAAVSCPPLLNRAWRAETLNEALEEATRSFVAGPGAELKGKTLSLSKLFEWYASDFEAAAGSVQSFVGRYLAGAETAGVVLRFKEYDWRLNGR